MNAVVTECAACWLLRPGVRAGSRFLDQDIFERIRLMLGEKQWDTWKERRLDEWAQLEER